MIGAAMLAIALAGQPAVAPRIEPVAARYYLRRKRHIVVPPPASQPHTITIEEQAPRRVRVIPIISFDEFYRRVGL